jgi:dCTP deaminase
VILKADEIAQRIEAMEPEAKDPLFIVPRPNLEKLKESGSASIDLNLGTWFVTPRHARMSHIDVGGEISQSKITKMSYVPFKEKYYLHPHRFVLGVTLQWIRLPKDLAGYLVGKSSLGRCGLIIATAVGVHPGFVGCLTLELTNTGEVPIHLKPGMKICQLFLHQVYTTGTDYIDRSRFVGRRRPVIEGIKIDEDDKNLLEGD